MPTTTRKITRKKTTPDVPKDTPEHVVAEEDAANEEETAPVSTMEEVDVRWLTGAMASSQASPRQEGVPSTVYDAAERLLATFAHTSTDYSRSGGRVTVQRFQELSGQLQMQWAMFADAVRESMRAARSGAPTGDGLIELIELSAEAALAIAYSNGTEKQRLAVIEERLHKYGLPATGDARACLYDAVGSAMEAEREHNPMTADWNDGSGRRG